MGVVAVVTGSPTSTCATQVRSSLSPDDTLVVVATRPGVRSRDRFVVDASSSDSFSETWGRLTGAALGARLRAPVGA
jgi:hypothetical protein